MGRLLLGLRQEQCDGLYGGWEEKVGEESIMERAEACAQEEVGYNKYRWGIICNAMSAMQYRRQAGLDASR